MTARIQVKYVNPPKPHKTNGSIKTPDDQMFGVKPDMLGLFQPNGTYDVEFSERQFNGQTYKTVTSVKKVDVAPAPSTASGGAKYDTTDDKTAERIFVCGALNAMISGGHVEVSQVYISNVVNVLRASWAETFGSNQPPKFDNPDMGDESIPF